MHSLTDHVSLRIFPFSLQVSFNSAAAPDPSYLSDRLPPNVTLVPKIKRFLPVGSQFNEGQVELVNGTVSTILHICLPMVTRMLDYFWTRPHYLCDRLSIHLSFLITVP